ncbi:MAG: hypothetical protein DME50_05625 [Verrucomicrobia bacterium]|nr:MAG: hypothetical protein DME50_05625 [Verrucomicrobiota bacterium]
MDKDRNVDPDAVQIIAKQSTADHLILATRGMAEQFDPASDAEEVIVEPKRQNTAGVSLLPSIFTAAHQKRIARKRPQTAVAASLWEAQRLRGLRRVRRLSQRGGYSLGWQRRSFSCAIENGRAIRTARNGAIFFAHSDHCDLVSAFRANTGLVAFPIPIA